MTAKSMRQIHQQNTPKKGISNHIKQLKCRRTVKTHENTLEGSITLHAGK